MVILIIMTCCMCIHVGVLHELMCMVIIINLCAMNNYYSQVLFRFIATTKIVNRIVSCVSLCLVIIVHISL